MKKWTTQQRYAPYGSYSAETLAGLIRAQRNSRWHLSFHIQPRSGLLNDPNGFTYYNHQWHVFYQNFPYGPVHGLKSWRHVTSPDLVHWQEDQLTLEPRAPYSTQGVYSGSALPVNDQLFLMYTGNVRTTNGGRISTQLGAWLNQDEQLTASDLPLITQPSGYTPHFRDPQILHVGKTYYALLGAQRADHQGQILLYQADAVNGPWSLVGPLDLGHADLGYMIECPNLAFVDGHVVLIFCPQGLDRQRIPYANIYPNMVIVADAVDWQNARLVNPGPVTNLDEGFDCYATQVVNGPDHQAYAISWLGLPDTTYPSDREGWQGCLSLVKALHVVNGQLRQTPVTIPAATSHFEPLRDTLKGREVLTFDLNQVPTGKIALGNGHEELALTFDGQALTIDRRIAGEPVDSDYGNTRKLDLLPGSHQLALWLDRSSFELFIDDGQRVASGRIFPHFDTPWRVTTALDTPVQVTGQRLPKLN
ncbi:sucrose-6-phosphate hydrolase [Lactiplantibacillus garii]|uniref:Sucrose-6-phosphate hydrolase n=1 Tax=Lactiplantibacillus garii TaxID=2306423 RepID=A0A426D6E2_9LACO|nr:sucrose-6-phosphate hydrolase [Lactiplantibacillus garii]RRK10150.1 sucrose-6-phosphate hydrolase [Lactiplantibacillus garii]